MNFFRGPSVQTTALTKKGVETGAKIATISSAVAVLAGAAGAGPALPVVAAVAVIAVQCAKIYAQNKKLSKMFIQTHKLVEKVYALLSRMVEISKKRNLNLDVTEVQTAAQDIRDTIARIAGPDTIRQIEQDVKSGQDPSQKPPSFWQRFRRTVTAGEVINDFREKIVNLSLAFNILQTEFALQLDDPKNEDIVEIPAPPTTPEQTVSQDPAALEAAVVASQTPAPAQGAGRTRRRRSKRSKTVKRGRRY
jgi:hypothetical protein